MSACTGLQRLSPDLVRRAREGDEEALRDLVTRAHPIVRRWALVRTGDPTEADDLAQDVLVQMIRRLASYQGTAAFGTWLYTVTRNAAEDRRRLGNRREKARRSAEALGALLPARTERPDEALDRERLASLLRAFFEELPPRQREVLDLSDLQGFTSPEIAGMLGIEPVSVRAHLFKARRTLRRRILKAHPYFADDL